MSRSYDGDPVVGIFVGGRGTRLGGVAKGNLALESGEKLVTRLVRVCSVALPNAPLVLVGAAEAYSELGIQVLSDEPTGIGPLGGLRALLLHAERLGRGAVLALACDLPHLGAEFVRRLATDEPQAEFLAPRGGELWQTLVARYGVSVLPAVDETLAHGDRALQRLVQRLGARAVELSVSAEEHGQLFDWDTPEDVLVGPR